MRDYLIEEGDSPLPFIGTVTLASSPVAAAENIRRTLSMDDGWAEAHSTWTDALVGLRRAVEDTGVLVVINGVVGNNTRQKLDPEEFRGFVLCDNFAPLIFINGADFKSAQMFTWRTNWRTCGWGRMAYSTCRTSSPRMKTWRDSATRLRRRY